MGASPLAQAAQRLAAPSAPADTGTRANGRCHDAPPARRTGPGLPPLADRGAPLVAAVAACGTGAVIAPRRKRRHPRAYDAVRYAQRYPVERLFSRLKRFRRVATRYDKLDAHFLAFIHLAATILWLRDC